MDFDTYYNNVYKKKKKNQETNANNFDEYYNAFIQNDNSNIKEEFNDYYSKYLAGELDKKETTNITKKTTNKKNKALDTMLFLTPGLGTYYAGKKAIEDVKKLKNAKFDFLQKPKNFDNGYQVGDVTATLLGSTTDALAHVGHGITSSVEGGADWVTNRYADIQDLFGKHESAEKTRRKSEQNWDVNNKLLEASQFMDDYSIFGQTSKSVAEGVGTSILAASLGGAGQAAAGSTAVGSALSLGATGINAAGGNENQARLAGASNEDARLYGIITGAGEAASEAMFGGISKASNTLGVGKGVFDSVDDAVIARLTKNIDNAVYKNLVQAGLKGTSEGVEELVSDVFDVIAKKLTYMKDEDIIQLIKDENWLEDFVTGTLSAYVSQAPGVATNTQNYLQTGTYRDYVTGLTENEQKVLDNVIEQRIEEATKNKIEQNEQTQNETTKNQELSKKEMRAIEKQAKSDLQNGNISVEAIEDTLGLKDYIDNVVADVENKMGRQMTQQEVNEIAQLTRNRFIDNLQGDRMLQNSYVNQINQENNANVNNNIENNTNAEQNIENQVNVQPEQTTENKAETSQNESVKNNEIIEQKPITNDTKPFATEKIEQLVRDASQIQDIENTKGKTFKTYIGLLSSGDTVLTQVKGTITNINGVDVGIYKDANGSWHVIDLNSNFSLDKQTYKTKNEAMQNAINVIETTDLSELRNKIQERVNNAVDISDYKLSDFDNVEYDNKGNVYKTNEQTTESVDTQQVATKEEVAKQTKDEVAKQIKEKVPTTKEIADKVEKKVTKQVNDAIAPLKDSIDEINKSIEKVMDNIAPVVEQANKAISEIDYDKLYENMSPKDVVNDQFKQFAAETFGEEYTAPQTTMDEQGNKQVIPKEKSAFRQAKDTFKRLFTNSNVEIDNLAEESGNKNIKYAGDMLNAVSGEAQGDISVAQTNNNGEAIGESLDALFADTNNNGESEAFNDYLVQWSNIDRHKQGKGSIVPSGQSEYLIKEYDKTYPHFYKKAQKVWNYGANARANLVDAGIISQELSNRLADMYPHFIPYITDSKNINNIINDTGEIIPKSTIKRAKGGANIGQLLPVQEALERYTYSQKKAVRQNQLYQQIVGTLSDGAIDIGADMREFDNNDFTSMSDSLYRDENGNYLTAYVDGERKSVRISEDLYNSLSNDLQNRVKEFENRFRFVTKPLQKISEVRRNLLTTWNPSFALTNPIKDIQDASLNSKYPTAMAKNVPRAVNELFRNNTDRVRQFRTLYGAVEAFGEFENNTLNQKAKNNKFVRNLINFNENMELAPRYAEFLASVENGASIQEAMYNAREVTTNFSRGGVIAKALNRNGFTFLNANIQGLSKFYRNIKGENGIRGTVGALTRAAALGIAPAVFNEIAFGTGDDKDEEYEALPDYVKDNYYIIKTSDGNFIRIPKGRMLSVFGSAARRTIEALEGEENAFEGYLKNAYDQVGVGNPLNNNIVAPLIQAFGSENGTNWYGGDLVPTRLQNVPKGEQTDASIDAFSTWLGEKLNVSPYKINYVLDQYSGGIGDIVLPMMTQEATNDTTSIGGQLLAPLKDKFTVNATDDNKYVSDFYSKSQELQVKANSKNATDEDALREKYMYSISKGMSELYKERREVQADDSLTKEEKYAKSQAIKDEINRLAKVGLDGYNNIEGYGNYMVVGDDIGYYKNAKGEWKPINEDDITFIESQGLTDREKSEYFSTKNDIGLIVEDYKERLDGVENTNTKNELYASKKKEIAKEIQQMDVPDETKAYMFDKYYSSADKLSVITNSGIDFNTYLDFAGQTFTADKDRQGKTINGSKKQKVYNYINSMNNLSYGEKCILAKLEYKSDNRYNNQIIQYLNNSNLDYDTEVSILKELGFKVSDDGRITW